MTRGRGSPRIVFHTAPYVCNFCQTRFPLLRGTCASSRHSILRLWRGPSPRACSLGTVSHWLSYRSHPIRPCGAPSPRGEGCDTRIPSSKQAAHHPCEPIRSPSTVIPSEAEGSLLHCRHMHTCALTQTTPWCFLFRLSLTHVLPVCRKDPSTSVGMTGGRQIASHSLSHRFVDPSCAFGAPLL